MTSRVALKYITRSGSDVTFDGNVRPFGESTGEAGLWDDVDGSKTLTHPAATDLDYRRRLSPEPAGAGASESAALYLSTVGTSATKGEAALFIETINDGNNYRHSAIKILHNTARDAIYVANFGGGLSVEAAGFVNGSRGFAGTLQWEGADTGAHDFQNSILFSGIWGYSTTPNAGSTTAPNYGMIYLQRSLGKAIRIKAQDPAETGYVEDPTEIIIEDYSGRDKVTIGQNGQVDLRGRVSDAENTSYNDSYVRFGSSYWTGAASQDRCCKQKVSATSGACTWQVYLGNRGSETLQFQVTAAGSGTFSGNTMRLSTARTIAAFDTAGNAGNYCFDDDYMYYYSGVGGRWYRIAWNKAEW